MYERLLRQIESSPFLCSCYKVNKCLFRYSAFVNSFLKSEITYSFVANKYFWKTANFADSYWFLFDAKNSKYSQSVVVKK